MRTITLALLALALEGGGPAERAELLALLHREGGEGQDAAPFSRDILVRRVHRLFSQAQVFERADKLVEKYRALEPE